MQFFEDKKKQLEDWVKGQPPSVEVGLITAGGAVQGGALGALMATFSSMEPPPQPGVPAPPKPPGMVGGPWVLGRNFAVMTGVNAGLAAVIKKARGGVEDVQGSMMASFGAGTCFQIVSTLGAPPGTLPAPVTPVGLMGQAVTTGAAFALIQGAFYQLGNMFGGGAKKEGPAEDVMYMHTRGMLAALGLMEYEKNFKKGLLNDQTLPLLTDSALKEVKIPPGPRLRILHHVALARAAQANTRGGKAAAAPAGPQQVAQVALLSLALPIGC